MYDSARANIKFLLFVSVFDMSRVMSNIQPVIKLLSIYAYIEYPHSPMLWFHCCKVFVPKEECKHVPLYSYKTLSGVKSRDIGG